MNSIKNDDFKFGSNSEQEILDLLSLKFGEINKTTDKYNPFDFEGSNIKIELKTRRIKSDQYPTTMIGYNKIKLCKDPNISYYFVFKFTDKTLYCQYCIEDFKDFEVKKSGRSDRGCIETNDYLYIPISFLKQL